MKFEESLEESKQKMNNCRLKINNDWKNFINAELEHGDNRMRYLVNMPSFFSHFLKNMYIDYASWEDEDFFKVHVSYEQKNYWINVEYFSGSVLDSDEKVWLDFYDIIEISNYQKVNIDYCQESISQLFFNFDMFNRISELIGSINMFESLNECLM